MVKIVVRIMVIMIIICSLLWLYIYILGFPEMGWYPEMDGL